MAAPHGRIPFVRKLLRAGWMIAGTVGIGVVIYFILFPPRFSVSAHASVAPAATAPKKIVELRADGAIRISPDTPFSTRIATAVLTPQQISDPLLTVSGIVVARVLPGSDELADRWHFNTPELSTAHANWLRSNNEIEFLRNQLAKTRALVNESTTFLEAQVKRLEPNAKSGVIPEKDILAARSDLLKAQLQGQKDIFAAQSALRVAENERVALERELSQRGIEPVVFSRPEENMVLVSANVPEAKISEVKEGQACRVKFYAHPDKIFDAHVETLSTTVTEELRTLRVLFHLTDPDNLLLPGMFAEVELGTDQRTALVIPAPALLHVGQADYVIVQTDGGAWLPKEVVVGEFRRGFYEVLRGLSPGQTIISQGTILLKPKVVESLARLGSKQR
jgi:hypothetical protein